MQGKRLKDSAALIGTHSPVFRKLKREPFSQGLNQTGDACKSQRKWWPN